MRIRRARSTSGLRRAYRQALRRGDAPQAEHVARRIVEIDPSDSAMWFDLGLAAKRRRDWRAAIDLNLRALETSRPSTENPAAWNLGIAATAVGDWGRARQAWAAFGLEVPPDDGPVVMHPVRLNADGTELGEEPLTLDGVVHDTEVVWAERLSPAHARILSVPTPASGHRWGDVVLIDGVPHGERHDGQQWVPVFDELERLDRSPHVTWSVDVVAPTAADAEALVHLVEDVGLAAEDWTSTVRQLCAACSSGRPGNHDHDDTAAPVWQAARRLGMAGRHDLLTDALTTWASRATGRSWAGLVDATGAPTS